MAVYSMSLTVLSSLMIGCACLHVDHRYTFMRIIRSVDRLSHRVQMQMHK